MVLTLRALRISIVDGIFAQIFANLTGSIFLPAFALALSANSFQIGLLAAIPLFATIAQLAGASLIETLQNRKKLTIIFASLARSVWIPVIVLSIVFSGRSPQTMLKILILGILVYNIFGAISGVSWLSWMSTMVPQEIRGRYFGLRNSILGVFTILTTLLGGYYLDWIKTAFPVLSPASPFEILMIAAVISAGLSIFFLLKQPEIRRKKKYSANLKTLFSLPLRHPQFKKLLRFALIWSFAVNFASPFFIVYMLKDLHFSYTLVGALSVASSLADLSGMWVWGHFSDRIGNRPIVLITAAAATILPFLWIFTDASPLSAFLFIPLLHLFGGFFWAGYNLCAVNLVFRMAPPRGNSPYFALWASVNGITAGLGAIAGGVMANNISVFMRLLPLEFSSGFKLIFLISAVLRFFSLFLLKNVREAEGLPVVRAVRILRSIKSWTAMMGYHPVLQFFLPGHAGEVETSPYWPIWQRKDVK
ncbi:MAG: MFS transporter [Calditrichia bacterium]